MSKAMLELERFPPIGGGLKYNNQNIKTIGDAINSFIKVQTEIYQIS